MIANENGPLELRLRVAEQALAALASMKPTKDPAPWIKEVQETADAMLEEPGDQLWEDRIRWQIGNAYYHALRIEHTRQQPDKALAYGQKAIEYLAEGAKLRDAQPEAQEMVGLLYFHLGAVHAVYKQDHAKAVTWYEKAVPFLTDDAVTPRMTVPRRQGEALVSMAVSYWQQGEKQQALELTELGADQIEKAVAGGVIEQDVLAVPYGNLATMHKLLGNTEEAAKYKELANEAQATEQTGVAPINEPEMRQPTANRNRAQRSAMRQMPRQQSFRSFAR
jgi:tetratricopeptide (TPR) repeat protein